MMNFVGKVSYTPQPLPETGATSNPNLDGVAPLRILTTYGSNYYVKIEDSQTGSELTSYFIRSGDTLNVKLPLGSYIIKYASGDTWYGEQHLFGQETQYAKADEVFHFTSDGYQYSGYTITLYKQVNGNLTTTQLDPSQF